MSLFHRHKAVKVLRVWHGENLFGSPGTVITYLCECGVPYRKQVWGHYEKHELVPESEREAM